MNTIPVEGFPDFASWLGAVVRQWPSKAAFVRDVASPQLLEKWLVKTIPSDANLKKIAQRANVDYRSLKMLCAGIKPAADPADRQFRTRTEMGAIVGRKWEELHQHNDVAAMSILTVIETLVTLQRDSYRRYTRDQQAISRKTKVES